MRGGGGGGQQAGDQISSFFWVICIFAGVIILIWWLKREWIVMPVFEFRIYETYLLEFIANGGLSSRIWRHGYIYRSSTSMKWQI